MFVASNLMGVTFIGPGAFSVAGIIFEGNPTLLKPGNPGPGKPLNPGFGLTDGYLATGYCYLIVACILALLFTDTGLTLRISSIGLLYYCGAVIPPRKLSRSSSFLILSRSYSISSYNFFYL